MPSILVRTKINYSIGWQANHRLNFERRTLQTGPQRDAWPGFLGSFATHESRNTNQKKLLMSSILASKRPKTKLCKQKQEFLKLIGRNRMQPWTQRRKQFVLVCFSSVCFRSKKAIEITQHKERLECEKRPNKRRGINKLGKYSPRNEKVLQTD